MTTINGKTRVCRGVGSVKIRTDAGNSAKIDALVVREKPLEFDLLLGFDAIKALGGVLITRTGTVQFQGEPPVCAALSIDQPDFSVAFDRQQKEWTASWKWTDDKAPAKLRNRISEYPVPSEIRAAYEQELRAWIEDGWLIPYPDQKLGPPKGLIPLMAVVQQNKAKVRPVMDYRELNQYVDAFTADADVCASKLREWRQQGANVSLLDLRKAYLQVRVSESLWPFQTVMFKGRRYCLTRLGFGLNVAPQIMKTIISAVLSQEEAVERATSAYLDDIYVNEGIVPASRVQAKLAQFGLICKDPERLEDGARVLGLDVRGEHGILKWRRGSAVPDVPSVVTRRTVFSLCGKLVGHLPVCGWLRVATGVMKRRANAVTKGWDDEATDTLLERMMTETVARVRQEDPARGDWCVNGREMSVWVDASSLAIGVLLQSCGTVLEDACWLRPVNDAQHINLAELDAILKGINLALQWRAKRLHLQTDSLCAYHWVSDTLSGKARVRTKAASEMLIRRRLDTIKRLVTEYGLSVDITLVTSDCNLADRLTRVPQRWYDSMKRDAEPVTTTCAASTGGLNAGQIMAIHQRSGHPGVRRTWYFVRLTNPSISKSAVRTVVKECQACQSIDPAPVRWRKGQLGTSDAWSRVGMDITHYGGKHFLTLIDCGPTRFAVWRPLLRQDSSSVIRQLESVFCERGPPEEVLTDNDTAFCSQQFRQFLAEWGVRLRLRCAYVPSGNGIAERCHRSIKRIAARKQCTVMEAVYWYNVTPKDDVSTKTAPANAIHTYRVRIKGIDGACPPDQEEVHGPYGVGDHVWVKSPNSRCTTSFKRGRVTGIISQHSVMVDGTPRHIRDLRPALEATQSSASDDSNVSSESELLLEPGLSEPDDLPDDPTTSQSTSDDSSDGSSVDEVVEVPLRRSTRNKRPPPPCNLCDLEIRGECSGEMEYQRPKRPRVACVYCGWAREDARRHGTRRHRGSNPGSLDSKASASRYTPASPRNVQARDLHVSW